MLVSFSASVALLYILFVSKHKIFFIFFIFLFSKHLIVIGVSLSTNSQLNYSLVIGCRPACCLRLLQHSPILLVLLQFSASIIDPKTSPVSIHLTFFVKLVSIGSKPFPKPERIFLVIIYSCIDFSFLFIPFKA